MHRHVILYVCIPCSAPSYGKGVDEKQYSNPTVLPVFWREREVAGQRERKVSLQYSCVCS